MSDFLDSLIDRSLGAETSPAAAASTLRPLLPSRFEPPRATPLFSPTGWDASPEADNGAGADRFGSPFDSPPVDTTPRIAPVTGGEGNREDIHPQSPFPLGATGGAVDSTARPFRATDDRSSVDAPSPFAPRVAQRFEPDDNSWLHRRMDELSIQLQRIRGDMATPSTLHSALAPVVVTHDDGARTPQSIDPHQGESTTPELRPAPSLDAFTRGKDDTRSIATRPTENQTSEHSAQRRPPSPDLGRFEQLLSRAEHAAKPSPPDIRAEASTLTTQRTTPSNQSGEYLERGASPVPKFDQLDQLLSLAGRAAMQPPPRIQPEDLPSFRQPAPAEKTINVTIGRVEVKATREPTPARRPAPAQASASVMSLDDYMKQRAAGGL